MMHLYKLVVDHVLARGFLKTIGLLHEAAIFSKLSSLAVTESFFWLSATSAQAHLATAELNVVKKF